MAKKKTFKLYARMKKSKKSLDIRKYIFEAQKYEIQSTHSYIDNMIEPDLENLTWNKCGHTLKHFGKTTLV